MIAAEAIVAQVGILPKPDEMLTREDGAEATQMPKLWKVEVAAWLDQPKRRPFKLGPQFDFEKTLDKLSTPLPPDLFSQLTDQAVRDECQLVLDRARAYALSRWPVRRLDRPTGPVLLQPGRIELLGACSILAVLDDPDRILAELRMETLEEEQVAAFKSVYPDLYEMLVAIVWEEIDRKGLEKDYSMPWGTELIFRRLIGMPTEMSITKAQRPTPAAAAPSIKADFSKLKTRAQKMAEL